MKQFKTIISLLSMILLTSCASIVDSGTNQSSVNQPSSIINSGPESTSSAVIEKPVFTFEADKDIDLYQVLSYLIPDGEYEFTFPEFSSSVFKTVAVNSIYEIELYFNNTKIIANIDHETFIFASDINDDHYREIVCLNDKTLIIYDIHNNYEMFHKDLSKDEVSYLDNVGSPYEYALELYQERLIFKVWNGSRSDITYDYGYFSYDKQFNSLSINLQNMYEIQEFGYDSIYNGEKLIERKNDLYSLEKGVEYLFNFHITRKDNADLNKVIEGFANTKEKLPSSGIYVLINGELQSQTTAKIRCDNENGFGNYKLKLTLPNNVIQQGQIYVGYATLGFTINYQLV